MFIDDITNPLFNPSYCGRKMQKNFFKIFLYFTVFFIGCSLFYGSLLYIKQKPYIKENVDKMYSDIPEFTLKDGELKIEGDVPIEISFAGTNFYIDDSRTFIELAMQKQLDYGESITFIAKDGYAMVKGSNLERGNFYSDVPVLKGVVLTKDDMAMIYEIIEQINEDAMFFKILKLIIMLLVIILSKSAIYAYMIKSICFFKKKNISVLDALKVSLYGSTTYILFIGIFLISPMNISIIARLVILEILFLIYMLEISNSIIREEMKCKYEKNKNKKRCS